MRVQCVSARPSPEQVRQLGSAYRPGKTRYPVHEGIEYLVLGVGVWDGVVWVEIAMETETVVSVPLFLFRITSPMSSCHWEVRLHDDGGVTFWPRVFYEEHFHDRLSDGSSREVASLRELQHQLGAEDVG